MSSRLERRLAEQRLKPPPDRIAESLADAEIERRLRALPLRPCAPASLHSATGRDRSRVTARHVIPIALAAAAALLFFLVSGHEPSPTDAQRQRPGSGEPAIRPPPRPVILIEEYIAIESTGQPSDRFRLVTWRQDDGSTAQALVPMAKAELQVY